MFGFFKALSSGGPSILDESSSKGRLEEEAIGEVEEDGSRGVRGAVVGGGER